jgi:hypothetical protein
VLAPVQQPEVQVKPRRWTKIKIKNPVLVAMENAAVISDARNAEYAVPERNAITALACGEGDKAAWDRVARMLNVAELMAKSGDGVEVIAVAAEAQIELARAANHFYKTGKFLLTAEGAYVLREAAEYHDLQRRSVPYGKYRAYIDRTIATVKCGNTLTANQILEQAHEHGI